MHLPTGLMHIFFFFSHSVIMGLAMARGIVMLQCVTDYGTSQLLQVIGAGSSAH